MKFSPVKIFVHDVDTFKVLSSFTNPWTFWLNILNIYVSNACHQIFCQKYLDSCYTHCTVGEIRVTMWGLRRITVLTYLTARPLSPVSPDLLGRRRGVRLSHRKLSHLRQRWAVHSPRHSSLLTPHSSLVSSLEYLWAVVECRRQLIVWWTGPVLCSQSTQHLPLLTKLQLCSSHGSDYQLRDQAVCIALEGTGRFGGGEGWWNDWWDLL